MQGWTASMALAAVLIVVAGATSASTSGASEPDLAVTTERGATTPLEPGGAAGMWNLTVTYHTPAPAPEAVTVDIETHVNEGRWRAEVEPSQFTFRPATEMVSPTDRRVVLEAQLHVGATPIAPAFHADRLEIEATASSTNLNAPAQTRTIVTAVPGFRSDLDVRPEEATLTVPEGEQIHVHAQLGNEANGPTLVEIHRTDPPPGCQTSPIHEQTLLRPYVPQETAFHLACEEGASDGALMVTFVDRYAFDTSLTGEPVSQVWDVEVERSPAVEAQAALVGTSASLAGIPVSLLAGMVILSVFGVRHASGKEA